MWTAVPVELSVLKDVLMEAAAVVARFYRADTMVTRKPDGSPITQADREVNTFLREALRELLPAAAWLSEETDDDLSRLGYEWLWVVDPLDGTKEFGRGVPEFAISVGLVHEQRAVLGGVTNPASGEGGVGWIGGQIEFWGGLQNRPAVTSLSRARASVSRTEIEDGSVDPLLGMVGATYPVGGVAYKLLRTAAGQDDLTFSAQHKSEWDICGGVALLNSAGRVYRRFDGEVVRFNQRSTRIRSGAVAGNSGLVDQFLTRIKLHKGSCTQ